MKYLKLEEIANLDMGKTPARNNLEYWNGNNTWVSISDLKDKYISESKEKITDKAISDTKIKEVPKNTLIISFKLSIGKKAITTKKLFTNEAIMALKIKDENELDVEYLYYALEKVDLIRYTDKAAKGKTLNKEKLKKIEIPICDMYKQKKIVKSLNKVKMIISKKREQLESLENLKKSQFFEMFGDPIKNEKGWKIKRLEEITDKISSGATPTGGKENYRKTGISLIRSMNVHNGYFEYKDLAHISNEQAEQLKNVEIKLEDVLLNITGASITRCCLVPSNVIPARVNQHVMIIRKKSNVVNSIFLNRLFLNDIYKQKLLHLGEANGATRQALTKVQVESLKIILPPLELQNKFATRIEAIQKLKFEIEKSLKETENLYNSLMQKFFSNK